jgi:hypothetical protein
VFVVVRTRKPSAGSGVSETPVPAADSLVKGTERINVQRRTIIHMLTLTAVNI